MRGKKALGLVCLIAAIALIVSGGLFAALGPDLPPGRYEVPSLTVWGKVFSIMLLGALGVAYLVWRRPVAQARAILETSPLGTSGVSAPLVDLALLLRTMVILEVFAIVGIVIWRASERAITATDVMGVLGAAAIIAFVVHLLILGWRK